YKYDSALNKKVMAFLTRIIHELAEEGDLEQLDHTMFKLVDDERLMDKLTGIISLSEQREVKGSVAYTSYPTLTSSVNLQNANFSGLYATNRPTTTASAQSILKTEGSSSTKTVTTLMSSSTSTASNKLSGTDSGVIIGGSIAGVVVFIGLTICACLFFKRRRQPKHFNSNRMIFTHADQAPFTMVSQEKETRPPIPRIQTANTTRQGQLSPTTTNGARLSKYNYLSQAFSQMRNTDGRTVKLPSRDSTIDAYFMNNLEMAPPPSTYPNGSHQSLAVSSVSDVSKYSTNIQPYLQQTFHNNSGNKYQYSENGKFRHFEKIECL
ncbi:hypothetical protein CU098_001974, partial [Rhizopus stolonifer]